MPVVRIRPQNRRLLSGLLAGAALGAAMGAVLEQVVYARRLAGESAQSVRAQAAKEQAALRRVATLVARAVPRTEVFEAVTREVGMLSGADLARMERYEKDGTVTGVAGWSRAPVRLTVGTRLALDGVSIAGQVRRTGRPVRVDSWAYPSGEIALEARELGIRSSIGCPIIVAGRLWGVIAASSRTTTPFPPDTESRIGDFTELVATAIANAESRAELNRLVDEQAVLRRVATVVARGAPPQVVFAAVTDEATRLLEHDLTILLRFDAGGIATYLAGKGWRTAGLRPGSTWTPDPAAPIAAVRRTGRPARCDDLSIAPHSLADVAGAEGLIASIAGPIIVSGRVWGALSVSSRDGPLPPDTEQRLGNLTDLVAMAIANAESRAEITASRARVVAASDQARRRIERDLHDGAQQRLVSLGLELRLVESSVPPAFPELQDEIAQVGDELTEILDVLREMSRGIHPAILSEGGLGPALRTLARRAAVPVELDVEAVSRYPEPIEVAAYYVVSEALTNTAKHACATHASVALRERDGVLQLSVRDDGVGGAMSARGSGLIGLRDRVESLGGSIEVRSPAGDGTLLLVTLPVRLG